MKLKFTKLLLLPVLLLLGNAAMGQQGLATYTPTYSTGIAYVSIAGTGTPASFWRNTTSLSTDDNMSSAIPIGFDFIYDGVKIKWAQVSTNGFLNLNTNTAQLGNTSAVYGWTNNNGFTTAGGTLRVLAPFHDDLQTASNLSTLADLSNSIKYQTTGVAPNRVFTVEWINMQDFSTSSVASLNFQIQLFEGSNNIQFNYGTMTPGAASWTYTLGINSLTLTGASPFPVYMQYAQQTANTNTFSGTQSNTLATIPASNSRIDLAYGGPAAVPLSGTYTIPGSFANFTAAINALNYNGISGACTFNVAAGSTFTEDPPSLQVGGTAANPIIFQKSGGGANPVIRPTGTAGTSDAGIRIQGGDYITFDGIDVTENVGSAVEFGYLISQISDLDGAQNNTVKNTTITLNRANTISIGLITSSNFNPALSANGANASNVFMDVTVKNCYDGVLFNGATAGTYNMVAQTISLDNSNQITTSVCGNYNIIGDPATSNDIGNGTVATYGIQAVGQANVTIANNKVQNVSSTGSVRVDGIAVINNTPAAGFNLGTGNVFNNQVFTLRNTSTSAGVMAGIRLNNNSNAGTSLRVYNNFVGDLSSASTVTTTRRVIGISLQDLGTGNPSTMDIWHNSVRISPAGILCSNSCLEGLTTTTGPVFTVKNNILGNLTGAQAGGAKHYAIASSSATLFGAAGSASNFNDLYIANATNGFVGIGNATDYAAVANWTTATTQDGSSLNTDPTYTGATDLHASSAVINAAGTTAPGYLTTDIDCQARPQPAATNYDMGADEFAPPPCASAVGGTITPTTYTKCAGQTVSLSSLGATAGTNIVYQWQVSTTPGGPYTNVTTGTGFNSISFTSAPLVAGTYYYVLLVTCTTGPIVTGLSNEATVTVTTSPSVSVLPTTGTICNPGGTAVTLTASSTGGTGAVNFTWAPTTGLTPTTGSPVSAFPTSTTNYVVTGTDANGCTGTASSLISVGSIPAISAISATPATICSGNNSNLLVTAGNTTAYTVNSTPFAAIAIPGGATTVAFTGTDDGVSTPAVTLPFPFTFYGVTYGTGYIHTNGFLAFTAGQPTGTPYTEPIPTAATPNNYITLVHDDLNITGGGIVKYFTTGSAPNRIFVVDYTDVKFYNTAANNGDLDGQIMIFEADNHIEVHIGNSVDPVPSVKTIGLENATGTAGGVTPPGRNGAIFDITTPEAWYFAPSGGTMSYSWSPATFLSATNIANPVATAATATTPYTVTVTDAGCSATANITLNVNPLPTATMSGSATVCAAGTSTVSIALTGTGPWNFTYFDGVGNITVAGIASSPYTFSGAAGTTYTMVSVSDANCTGTTSGTAVIGTYATPTATMSGTASVCSGTSPVSIALTGTGPWNLTYFDGVSNIPVTGVASSPYTFAGTPGTTYSMVSVSDANCTGTTSGTATISTYATPTATVSGDATACSGSSSTISVALTGTGPWSLTTFDGTTSTPVTGIASSPYTFNVTPTSTTTYTVTAVSDANCTGGAGSGSATITVDPAPSGTFSYTGSPACQTAGTQSPTTVSLTAGGTYSSSAGLTLNGSTGDVDPSTSTPGTYTVTYSVTTGSCPVYNTTASITIGAPITVVPSATPSDVCSGGNSQLDASALVGGGNLVTGYSFSTNNSTSLYTLSSPTTLFGASTDDAASAVLGIGFTFSYEGSPFTQFSASSNGLIRLGSSPVTTAFGNNTTGGGSEPKIMPWYDDLYTGGTGSVVYEMQGSSPSRRLVIQWMVNNCCTGGATNKTFQAVLYEGSNTVQFIYGTGVSGSSASVGVGGLTSTNFNDVNTTTHTNDTGTPQDANGNWPGSGRMYMFTPGAPVVASYSWSPSTFLTDPSIQNPMAVGATASTTYTVTATADGCSANSNVTVNVLEAAITADPVGATVCENTPVTLTVTATNAGSYQWYGPSGLLVGETGSSYTDPGVTPSEVGNYYVVVGNPSPCAGSVTSANAAVNINAAPVISLSPAGAILCPNGTDPVTITASGALTYTWSVTGGSLNTSSGPTVDATATDMLATVSVIGNDGTCDGTATVQVAAPIVITMSPATPDPICLGSSTQLDASAAFPFTVKDYSFSTSGASSLVALGTPTTIMGTGTDDGSTASTPIGFTFMYEGVPYTDFAASSNGLLGMGGSVATDFSNTTDFVSSTIMPFWDDQTTGSDGGIFYELQGSAPNRKLIVEWHTAYYPNFGAFTQTYQAILSETSNTIEFRFGSNGGGGSATMGLEGALSSNYNEVNTVTHTNTNSTPEDASGIPASGRSYLFTPATTIYSWTPAVELDNAAIANPMATPTASGTAVYNLTVSNSVSGCSNTGSVSVNVNPNGQWLGITNDWNDAPNWCGGVPTASSNVIIPATGSTPFDPVILLGNTGNVHNINLQSSSVTVASSGTMNLYGDVSLSPTGTFSAAGGTVNFAGSSAQNILPGFTTGILLVNGGGNKTLNSDVTVTVAMALTSGKVILNGNDLIMAPGSGLSGGSSTSYVQTTGAGSELVQEVSAGAGNVFFAVGSGTYNPAVLSNSGVTDNFRVHVRDEVLDGGTSGSQVNSATTYVINHTWDIEEDVLGGSNACVFLTWGAGEENNPLFEYPHVYVSHYYAGSWHHDGYAYATDAPSPIGYPGAGPYISGLCSITSFSPFTIGSSGGSTPLPVHLTDVSATNEGPRNRVEWHSAAEAGLDHYEVERSTDGNTFSHMTDVAATGHAFGYLTYDNQPNAGLTYYRIKMVEQGGLNSLSQIVYAFMKVGDNETVTVFPNPVTDVLHVEVFGATDKASVMLTDLSGKVISPLTLSNGKAEFSTANLASGVYFVKFTDGGISQTIKVNKQ